MSLKGRLIILSLVLIPAVRLSLVDSHSENSASKVRVASTQTTQSAQINQQYQEPQPIFRSEVSLQYGQQTFTEKDVSIEGNMTGVNANILFGLGHGLQAGIRGEFMSGDSTYRGQYQTTDGSQGAKAIGPGKDEFYDIAGIGQVDIFRESGSDAGFFTGIGYRVHNNNQVFAGGYPREISALYLPLGLNSKVGLSTNWSIRAEGEFDYLISGKTTSVMSKNGPEYGDFTNDQSSGYGIRASLRAQYQISKVSFALGPYYSYWKVDDSNSVPAKYKGGTQYMIEPANSTSKMGISLGIIY
jgi:hypothetical protein